MTKLATAVTENRGWNSSIEAAFKAEAASRQKALDESSKLNAATIDYMKARTEALKRSDAIITIDGAGLQPHLEAFMFEILKAIQVRANAEGAQFLTGI